MSNATLFRIGVIMYALVLLVFGFHHFMFADKMAGGVPHYMPGGKIWIYITGAGFILAAIAFLVHRFVRIAALLVAAMLIIFILTIHLPGLSNGNQMAMVNLLKDTAMTAAALMIAGKW